MVLLSAYAEQHLVQSMRVGAVSCLPKEVKERELMRAIRDAYSGHQDLAHSFGTHSPTRAALGQKLSLSSRQQDIIRLVADGITNKEIAYRLHLSNTTVKREMRSIFDKLGAADRAEAVSLAYKQGILG